MVPQAKYENVTGFTFLVGENGAVAGELSKYFSIDSIVSWLQHASEQKKNWLYWPKLCSFPFLNLLPTAILVDQELFIDVSKNNE